MLKKCNNSLTAFIAEAYTISTDDILKKDLESYWAYKHFYSARSRTIEACTTLRTSMRHMKTKKQGHLFFTAMLSQHSHPPTAYSKGARAFLKKKSFEKRALSPSLVFLSLSVSLLLSLRLSFSLSLSVSAFVSVSLARARGSQNHAADTSAITKAL